MDRKKAMERIVKLFKLAGEMGLESNTTDAEMSAAATKARQIMTEYNIAFAELKGVTDKATADRIEYDVQNHTAYTRKIRDLADYDRVVAAAVEKLFDVRSLYYSGRYSGYASMKFVGEVNDAHLAADVFHIILTHVRRAARKQYGSASWGKSHTSYAVGFARRLVTKADELAKAAQPEVVALVLASKSGAVQRWIDTNIEWDTAKPKTKNYDIHAYHAGYHDGAAYNIDGFRQSIHGDGSKPGEDK